jgi:hypothetical protein
MPVCGLAVVPATPLLVPAVAGRSDPALDELRLATTEGIGALLATRPETIVVVGAGPDAHHPPGTAGSFRDLGVDLRVCFGDDHGAPPGLPLALAVGAWLLANHPARTPAAQGRSVTEPVLDLPDSRVGLLVVADGTACRGPQSPGADDPRAEGFDDRIADALAEAADPLPALQALHEDPAASELKVTGLPAMIAATRAAGPGPWFTRTFYDDAPFGVGSFVVSRERV